MVEKIEVQDLTAKAGEIWTWRKEDETITHATEST